MKEEIKIALRGGQYSRCFSVLVTPEMDGQVSAYCNNHRISKTEFCRRAIRQYLDRQDGRKESE